MFFFFPQEKFKGTHSLKIRGRKKKNSVGKKKNSIFTHSLDFCPKVVKNKLFQGNKKIRYLCWEGGVVEIFVSSRLSRCNTHNVYIITTRYETLVHSVDQKHTIPPRPNFALFYVLHGFLRQMTLFLTDMSNRVEHQKLNLTTAELPFG